MAIDGHNRSSLAERQKTPKNESLWNHTPFRWFVGFIAVLAVLIGLAAAGQPAPVIIYLFLSPFALAAIRISYARASRKKLRTEEDYEEDWEQRKGQHQALLDAAKRLYAKTPAGRWRIYYFASRDRSIQTVSQQRYLEFREEGTGVYEGMNVSGLSTPIRVTFRHKPGIQPFTMQVQMVEPHLAGWHDVTYGFEIWTGDSATILMWFDAENPLPEQVAELWPFQGEVLREGDCADLIPPAVLSAPSGPPACPPDP